MKSFWSLLALLTLLMPLSLHASQGRVVSIAPVAHLIATELLQETGIDTEFLPPARLPVNRIPGWLRRVDAGDLESADVVITIESVWPSLPLYPLMRSVSIQVVPIDLATELAPGGARVLMHPDAVESEYFWLDLNNLTQMINVASKDLSRVWPEESGTIERNRFDLQRAIQRTQIRIDGYLLERDIETLSLADERLMPLAQSLGMPISETGHNLRLTLAAADDQHPEWLIDPLHRIGADSLKDWLTALETGLQVN
ncbi:hypothetical protein LH51_01865 [Nitrincola sp. A-D6]|nr:hypothetical protein LH51_01865 [Nitrincola sp. A-D6]